MIVSMGFSENAANRALSRNGNDAERAIPWILEHAGDPSVNDADAGRPAHFFGVLATEALVQQSTQRRSFLGVKARARARAALTQGQGQGRLDSRPGPEVGAGGATSVGQLDGEQTDDINLAMAISASRSPAPAPAPSRVSPVAPSLAGPAVVDEAGVAKLVELGFEPAVARQALEAAGGSEELAVEILFG